REVVPAGQVSGKVIGKSSVGLDLRRRRNTHINRNVNASTHRSEAHPSKRTFSGSSSAKGAKNAGRVVEAVLAGSRDARLFASRISTQIRRDRYPSRKQSSKLGGIP